MIHRSVLCHLVVSLSHLSFITIWHGLHSQWTYVFLFPLNFRSYLAVWSTWADTTPCSKSCATGEKWQARDCYRDDQIISISNCNGINTRETKCNPQRCRKLTLGFVRRMSLVCAVNSCVGFWILKSKSPLAVARSMLRGKFTKWSPPKIWMRFCWANKNFSGLILSEVLAEVNRKFSDLSTRSK